MRTRKEIEEQIFKETIRTGKVEKAFDNESLILEVLLDIRDLLTPKVAEE